MRESISRVRVGGKMGKKLWTARGVKQRCPVSPLLFNLLMADLEEELRKGRWGGIRLGEQKIYSLVYADDVVLLAENEEGMKAMMSTLKGYVERKGLELNEEKSKIMRFRKGGGRGRKGSWWCRGKRIEEVKEYRYLEYLMQRNGGQEAQVEERVRKGAAVMGQMWGIGKRKFGRDCKRRLWLFDMLVWTVMGYWVEMWGWKQREKMERLQEKYISWLMEVD